MRSAAPVRSISSLDTLRLPFARILSACYQKENIRRYKSNVRRLQGCGAKHKRLFTIILSSEVPSRLSTNTHDIGECDRSEGLR